MRIVIVGGCEWTGESSVKKEILRSRYEVTERDSTIPLLVTVALVLLLLDTGRTAVADREDGEERIVVQEEVTGDCEAPVVAVVLWLMPDAAAGPAFDREACLWNDWGWTWIASAGDAGVDVVDEWCLSGDASLDPERLEAADPEFGSTYLILRRIEGQKASRRLPDSFTLLSS